MPEEEGSGIVFLQATKAHTTVSKTGIVIDFRISILLVVLNKLLINGTYCILGRGVACNAD
ncbi:hypothetical protein BEL04_10500 [Mucilaginibacter sp. PPCGB 2223]|nr:hypothetical protein BEL04_10500 [Mucilaginibacter sp. PPCGB 2223]